MLYSGYFWAGFLKNYCHIWSQYPRICFIAKVRAKTKIVKFETKNILFGCFGQYFEKLLLFFKLAPSTLFFGKHLCKIKIIYQECFFWYFWSGTLKTVIFETSTSEFVKSKFLTYTVNFGIDSTLVKRLGSTFSQGPGLSSDPLYKACLQNVGLTL